MANELQVILGADGQPLSKTLSQLKAELKSFTKELDTAKDPLVITNLNKRILETNKNIGILKNAGVNAFSGMRPGVAQATQSLTDVSRIIQDLPFGLRGITNNIAPAAEGFGRLAAASGGIVPALGAVLRSLAGPAGLIFAASAIPSIFQLAQDGIQNFGKKSKDAKDEVDELLKSMRSASQVKFDAEGGVQGQIIQVQRLAEAVRDETRSLGERKNALDQLKQANESYFGDLTLQTQALGKLPKLVEDYTRAIITNAIVQETKSEIGKVGAEYLKQNRILLGLIKTRNAHSKQYDDDIAKAAKEGKNLFIIDRNLESINLQIAKQQKVVEPLGKAYDELTKELNESVAATLKQKSITGDEGKGKKEIDHLKQRIEALKEIVALERQGLDKDAVFVTDASLELKNLEIKLIRRDGKENGFSEEEIKKLIFLRFPDFDGTNLKLSTPTVVTAPIQVRTVFDAIGAADPARDNITQGVTRMYDRLIAQGQKDGARARRELARPLNDLTRSLNSILADSLANTAEAIGESLAGAVNPAKAFVDIIATALQQIGKALIAFGVTQTKVFATLKAGVFANPFVAIGAGVAAIAASALLRRQLENSVPRLAEGGITKGPTLAMIGEAGREVVAPLDKLKDLMGVGGTPQVEFVEVKQRGGDLYEVWKFHHARNNRLI